MLRVHALAHATGRGTVVPAWPLLPSTLHPRGAGLDVVLDLRPRDDRDTGSVQVGRAFTPRGTPRWWCQVRLGWPQRG